MTKGELVDMLVSQLKDYYKDGVTESIIKNSHMNKYDMEEVPQEVIDAILVDFVNYLGNRQGIDLGLYTEDLHSK